MNRYKIYIVFGFLLVPIFLSCDQGDQVQFAWLSDTHISENGSGAEDLQAAVLDINSQKNIDFVIISGDITEADWGDNLEKTKSILNELNQPYFIIPGNHDTKWSESGGQNFKQLFGHDKFVFDVYGYKFIGLHQGPVIRMADGHFAPEDLRWIDSTLVNLTNPNQPLIFVTHYPIDSSVDNFYEFIDMVDDYNIKLILHGHGHRNRIKKYANIPGVMGRSSLRENDEQGGYNLVNLKNDSVFFSERITGISTKSPWGTLSLKNDLSKTKTKIFPEDSINNKNSSIKLEWIYDAGYTVTSSPVYQKDFVYIGIGNGELICLNAKQGELVWQFKSDGAIYANASTMENRLVFASVDSFIYCMDSSNGKLIWKYKSHAPIVTSPIIEHGNVYCGGSDHIFRSLNLSTGELIWEFKGISGFVETKPLIYLDLIIFGAWDETLYAIDKNTGDLVWKWKEGRPGKLYSPAACHPVAANGKIFIVAPDRCFTAINAKTGKTVWRSKRFMVRETIGISEDGSQIYAECMRDTVIAVSSKANRFNLLWASNCDYGYDIAPSMLIEKNGIIFFATKNGLVYALNSTNGHVIWQYKFENTLINTVTPINSKELLFSNFNGKVGLLKNMSN